MEDLLVSILLLIVLWLVAKQISRQRNEQRLQELADLIEGFDRRLTRLEQAPPPAVTPRAADIPSAANIPSAAARPSTAAETLLPVLQPLRRKAATSPPALAPSTPPSTTASSHHPAAPTQRPAWTPPAVETIPTQPAQTKPARSLSLEERLGQNWLSKLGIVSLVIGLACYLGRALLTMQPAGRSAIGITLSLAILAGGIFLERRDTYRLFARAMVGGGWALIFFVTFALYHVDAMKMLQSQALDLILMLGVAGAMVWHSLRYKSQVVTSLAFLLAFVTVGISEVTFFSLVAGAILSTALLYIVAREDWYELALCGLIGVYLNHFLWLHRVLPGGATPGHPFARFLPSVGILLFYWLLFRLFYVLRVPPTRRQQNIASVTAVLNSVGLMSLLKFQSSHPGWAFYGLLALGSVEMLLAFLARRRNRSPFVVLSTIASTLLLAAIPFRFSGSSWSLLWLFQAEMLFLVGLRMPEAIFRRLGLLAGFAVAAQIFIVDALPIFTLRSTVDDPSRHIHTFIALFTAALLFWFNAEFAPHRWSIVSEDELDRGALGIMTYAALALAATGLWVFFPGPWTSIAWLLTTLALGLIADRLTSTGLAAQTDILAFAAIARVVAINFNLPQTWITFAAHPVSMRALTVLLAVTLLYLNTRRRTHIAALPAGYIAPLYSWVATIMLAALACVELPSLGVAVAWGLFGVTLFELGFAFRKTYLRHQGYALLVASFVRLFVANLDVPTRNHTLNPRVATILPLIAAYLWVYNRIHRSNKATPTEQTFAGALSCCGVITTAALLYCEVRAPWIAIAWTLLSIALLALAFFLRRSLPIAQSLIVLLAAALRLLFVNMFTTALATTPTDETRVVCTSLTAALMLLALPIAFAIRRRHRNNPIADWRTLTLFRPEQPFFFVPLTLLTVLLAVELRAGMITIGWSTLGVLAFLFALTVKERSYRLAGLGLLMLGVTKILLVDIWHASPTDRYITLIVMGAALLLVSFLYSRYRETLLKLL